LQNPRQLSVAPVKTTALAVPSALLPRTIFKRDTSKRPIHKGCYGMSTQTIQHAYNDVVAAHYDLDPQQVTGKSLDRAVRQLQRQHFLDSGGWQLKVLDLGMGTGMFLTKLRDLGQDQVVPFGLDLAENMVANARLKMPDLTAAVDDAANVDEHFPAQMFDCISTHFITGFVPMQLLAPKIWKRLEQGGYWSFVGGTKAGFPALQTKADSKMIRWLCGAGSKTTDDLFINPANQREVEQLFQANGFEVCEAETFEPAVDFHDFDEFMEFGYQGGWFTPIIETIGMQKWGVMTRWLLNRIFFPVFDHHSIAIVLARKVT
jgi:SAM-dependent methyltransferase